MSHGHRPALRATRWLAVLAWILLLGPDGSVAGRDAAPQPGAVLAPAPKPPVAGAPVRPRANRGPGAAALARQGGDTAAEAVPVPGLPALLTGTTAGFADDYDEICPYGGSTSPDVVYVYFPPVDQTVALSTCDGSSYDPKLYVYQGAVSPGLPYACNDDACPGWRSRIDGLPLVAGVPYYIVVDGYGGEAGEYALAIDESAGCPPPDCPPSALLEQEPNDDPAGGLANPLPCGALVCGQAPSYFGEGRDEDWFQLSLPQPGRLQLALQAGALDPELAIVDPVDFAVLASADEGGFCEDEVLLSGCLPAGDVLVRVRHADVVGADEGAFYTFSAQCLPCVAPALTIPELYALPDPPLGQPVQLRGFTTEPSIGLLVASWDDYEADHPLADGTAVELGGQPILPQDWEGAYVEVAGTLQLAPDAPDGNPFRVDVDFYTVLTAAYPDSLWSPIDWTIPAGCDSCLFGALVSGGWDGHNNHPRYWNNLQDFWCYKRSRGYCERNMKIFYSDGTPRDGNLPAARIDSCGAGNIRAWIADSLARRIAACRRAGGSPKLEVFITNHGHESGGLCLLKPHVLHPDSLTAWIQAAVDSGAACLEVENSQCHGGAVVDALRRGLARLDSCEVTVASATDSAHCARSKGGAGGYSRWGRPLAEALRDSLSLQEAIRRANQAYDDRLRDTGTNDEVGTGQYWRSIPSEGRCDSMQVQVTPGGTIELEWSGDARNCGNTTLYCQRRSDGRYVKQAKWNWNIPGSYRYQTGQNKRTITADTSGTGLYVLHNEDGPFRVTARSVNPPHPPAGPRTSGSNPEAYAGFSYGWRNGSSGEFAALSGDLAVVEELGLSLGELPRRLGAGGAASLRVEFEIAEANAWWADMELWLKLVSADPGELRVQAEGAGLPDQVLAVAGAGEWALPVGGLAGTGARALTLTALSGSFELDCWDLHSRLGTWPLLPEAVAVSVSGEDIVLGWPGQPSAGAWRVEVSEQARDGFAPLATVAAPGYVHEGAALLEARFYRVVALGD